jgi:hypothetical protein
MKSWSLILQSMARLILILLLPLSIGVHIEVGESLSIHYSCIISRISNPEDIYFDPLYSVESLGYLTFFLGSVFLITGPLLYFEYRMKSIPSDNSVLSSATVLFAVSSAIFIVLYSFLGSIYPYDVILFDVEIAFTWSIFLFLVFPILVRETKLLENHMTKSKPNPAASRYRPSKYTLLGYFLGIVVAIGPYHYETFSNNDWTYTILVSHSVIFNQSYLQYAISGPIYAHDLMLFTHTYLRGIALEISLLVSLGFCIYLLRYFKGDAKKPSLILTGLFSAFIAYIGSIIIPNSSFHLPTPLLLFSGLTLMKIIPVVKADESVWDETPERLWYERPEVLEEMRVGLVDVPLRYMILSRLRTRNFKAIPLESDIRCEKAYDEDS